MYELRVLDWEAVKPAVDMAFKVWVDSLERKWARQAWHHLTTVGLMRYSCEADRTWAIVRRGPTR